MSRRVADITLVVSKRGGPYEIRFKLACDKNTRFEEMQLFEIVSSGLTVTGTPLRRQVVNRSNGTTSVRMLAEERDIDTILDKLRRMRDVSDIKVTNK